MEAAEGIKFPSWIYIKQTGEDKQNRAKSAMNYLVWEVSL